MSSQWDQVGSMYDNAEHEEDRVEYSLAHSQEAADELTASSMSTDSFSGAYERALAISSANTVVNERKSFWEA